MNKSYILFSFVIILLLGSCIDPVDIKTTEEKNILVLEGFITTKAGPHYLKLSKSAKYGSIFEGFSQNEENASIFIKDDLGQQVFLSEVFPGTYATPIGYKAEVERTYTLIINSKSGQYISTPEKVYPVPEMTSIRPEFSSLASSDTLQYTSGVKFFSQFKDPAETQNFLLWTNNSTYEFNARPDLYKIPGPNGGTPAPKDCCDVCWKTEKISNSSIFLYNDNQTNGNEVQTLAYYVPDDGFRFVEKYLMRLEQHSLSKGAFQYYKLLKAQLEISGDIFDSPPASLNSNIINIDNPDSKVLGYFHATDVSIDSVFIDKSFMVKKVQAKIMRDDCRTAGNASPIKPAYWE